MTLKFLIRQETEHPVLKFIDFEFKENNDYFYLFQICTRLLWPMPIGKVEKEMKLQSLIFTLGKIHSKENLLCLLV